ncbi:MAG: hypothetical protein AAF657_06515 [Acidobacteriota bacterium]
MRSSTFSSACSVVALFMLLAGFGQPTAAAAGEAIIGHGGQLQKAIAGLYGDLFPTSTSETGAATPVLALDIRHADGESARLLVPGTDDARTESVPALFQDAQRDALIVLWLSRAGEDESQLHFAVYDGTEWSDVHTLEVDEAPATIDDMPLLAESFDEFELQIEGAEPVTAGRQILHLLWREPSESPRVLYAPLTFVEGSYIGWHNLLALNDIFLQTPETDDDDETEEEVQLSAELADTLSLRSAADGRSALVTFANPTSHRIGTVEISPLPLALGLLGEQVRDQIFTLAEFYDPNDLESYSDKIRAAIIIMGSHFHLHQAYGDYVADQVADWVRDAGEVYGWDLQSLGDDARDLAIDVSNEVYTSTKTDPADPGSEIIEIDVSGLLGSDEPDPTQALDFLVRSDLPAPAVGDGPSTVYTSRNGRTLLIAWENEAEGTLHWVESSRVSDGEAWSEPFSLQIGDDLSFEQAHTLLAARLR